MRFESLPTAYDDPPSASTDEASNQSSRGPSRSRSSRERRGMRTVSTATGGSPGDPTGSTSPSLTGSGPTPESRSVDREPSTGSTSMPPETAR